MRRWWAACSRSAALGGPLNGWGRQTFNVSSVGAAVTALAGVYGAGQSGHGQQIDRSLHESVITGTEQVLRCWFFRDVLPAAIAPRQASRHWGGSYQVMAAATGHIMVTPTPTPNVQASLAWLAVTPRAGREWRKLCAVIEDEQFSVSEGLATVVGSHVRRAVVSGSADRGQGDAPLAGGRCACRHGSERPRHD